MSLASISEDIGSSAVEIVHSPEGLGAIHERGCSAAIWQRPALPQFQNWIDTVAVPQLPTIRTILQPGAVRRAIHALCQSKGLPDCEERSMFVDDVAALVGIFASLMQSPYLRLRLDVIKTNACRKFHVDTLTTRLICTYRGTGTQYGIARDGREVETIQTVGTGSPILLRGSLWPVVPKSGLLHRSPPIEGTGETRLVLVLDPIDGPAQDDARHILH
ncbi:MAG: DUF1826 domain-containing protein [Pseudomonadota bacterium]